MTRNNVQHQEHLYIYSLQAQLYVINYWHFLYYVSILCPCPPARGRGNATRCVGLDSPSFRMDADRLFRKLYLLSSYAYRQRLPLTLLEVPIFSLREYNQSVGHHHPHLFVDQDNHLHREINRINETIREFNTISYKVSPQLSLDLERNRTNVFHGRRQYYHNYKLYRDEIHPKSLLGKLWLRKLSIMVKKGCLH